jgi:hypothetical protein
MTSAASSRPLRILHRSYAGDGVKPRPPYYSKLLALVSLLRAADAAPGGAELVFLNDGPMPADRLRVMEAHGEVRTVRRGGSDSASYREMLADEAARPAAAGTDGDVVWFAEDDYLYLPDAFARLAEGAAALPQADYLMLYGGKSVDRAASTGRQLVSFPDGGSDHPDAQVTEVDGTRWYRIASTTSTFGIRRRALREDLRLLTIGALTGGSWDSVSCRLVQGYAPYRPGELRADLLPFGHRPPAEYPKAVARGLLRTAVLPLSFRPRSKRRTFMGTDPEHAFHMELTEQPPHPVSTRTAKVDWAAVAAESAAWGRERGIAIDLPGRA